MEDFEDLGLDPDTVSVDDDYMRKSVEEIEEAYDRFLSWLWDYR